MAKKAPTEELRKTYEEKLQAYKYGFYWGAHSWSDWPMVMITPVLTETAVYKAVLTCRSERTSNDFLFTILSSEAFHDAQCFYVARLICATVHCLSKNELKFLPIKKKPLYDEEGELPEDKLREFFEDATFIRQR